jgi:hypothetical protein
MKTLSIRHQQKIAKGQRRSHAAKRRRADIILSDTSGVACPIGPCVSDNSVCGDVGECEGCK